MTVARSVSEVLSEHVTLTMESIDRLYLNLYVPILQRPEGTAHFWIRHRGHRFASSALMAPMTRDFVASIEKFARSEAVDLVSFEKGQRKEEVARERLAAWGEEEGVLLIGKAQEKAWVVRTERRRNPQTGESYPWLVKSTAMVNQYYFYCVDRDFGLFFLKFCSYFPYNGKVCLNGNEYLKRQLALEGIAFEALDNGLLSCAEPERAQQIADGLSADQIDGLVRKWFGRLPHPFPGKDRQAGYTYDLSILQAEFSRTQVFDRPLSGRVFFEQVIRDNLDLGRPDQVQLVFERRVTRRTPGRFRTRVLTDGVVPTAHRLQEHPDQAVPQGGASPPHRDHDQRHVRLQDRAAAAQSSRTPGDRLPSQPTSTRRPTDQPRLHDRRGRVSSGARAGDRRLPAGLGAALRRPEGTGPARGAGALPAAAAGLHQPRSARAGRLPARAGSGAAPNREHDLRPEAITAPRLHRTGRSKPALSGHRCRLPHRPLPLPLVRPAAPPRPGHPRPRHPATGRGAPAKSLRTARRCHRPSLGHAANRRIGEPHPVHERT